jgi:hypothetical protein
MIILDTNVISETMRSRPDQSVLAWLDERKAAGLFVTTITEAEIRFGIARIDQGKRRDGLAAAAEQAFETLFRGRVLPFDRDAARDYAAIAAHRFAIGRPISQFDCQIAAIARSRGAAVATRNVQDFAETGLELVNPWEGQSL